MLVQEWSYLLYCNMFALVNMLHASWQENNSASCLSDLTASVICVKVVLKVGRKAVLKAKALSDSYWFCDNSNTHDCLLGDN
jgi:hypothetical protein